MTATSIISAQDIKLPAANTQRSSAPLMQTLAERHSVRSFASTPLSNQEISDLCWAACGVCRDGKHLTAPTAMNRQEIRLYVFTDKAVYEYNKTANTLVEKAKGDHRDIVAGRQKFSAEAPVSLLMVMDLDLFGNKGEHARLMATVDAGIVCENINLYCQAVGLATVPRATMDSEAIIKLLGLNESQIPILNNPVGYEKK